MTREESRGVKVQAGPQLLGKTHVAEAIAERMKSREKRASG